MKRRRKNGSVLMVEKPINALYSGEIILEKCGGAKNPLSQVTTVPDAASIVDAEYEALPGTFGQRLLAGRSPSAVPAVPSGLEMLRGGTVGQTASRPRTPWIFGLAAVTAAFWLSGGHALLAHFRPLGVQSASFRISTPQSHIERAAGRDVLIVDGEAVNEGGGPGSLPDLSIDIVGADGSTTRYFLGTNGATLAAGARFAFSSRLAPPKDGVRSVSVTFRE